ncbi:MAG TPA: hypothetical protein VGQ28_00685, partial [Thermoanaerobaculia bacterium]|nr:hypothetical protein [Thermoanaerobaculia bacterium]
MAATSWRIGLLLWLMLSIEPRVGTSQVLWADSLKTHPRFVPEAVLAGTGSSTLSEEALSAIRAAIHDRVALYSKNGHRCAFQVIGDSNPGTGHGWRSLPDKVRAGDLVFRGEVEELTAGWDVSLSQAITMVGVRVDEVF